MISDLNKGIIDISYNHLNLPNHIGFGQNTTETKSINYVYSTTGTKLRKQTIIGGSDAIKTDYIGIFVYEEDELQFIQTSEGRLVPNENGGFKYEYAIKDHLGNTRVMFDETGEVLQDQSYYPFGMSMGAELTYNNTDDSPENKYLYNGKELQTDFDLGWYDYGARFYDPAIGRWHVVDPLAEERYSLTTFNYTQNNPVMRIDPDGMLDTKYEDEEGKLLLETKDGNDDVVKVSVDKVDDYKKHGELYEKEGMAEVYDSKGWNDNAKIDLLELNSADDLNVLDNTSSQVSRQKLIDYFQDDKSIESGLIFVLTEVASQNANPLNHIPAPINIKAKPKLTIKPNVKTKVNPWHKFRQETGAGKFTKEKYGSTEAAKSARIDAYKKWKEENGY